MCNECLISEVNHFGCRCVLLIINFGLRYEKSSCIEDSIVQIGPNYVNTRRGKADSEINIQKGFIQTLKVSAIVVKELSCFYLPNWTRC